MTGTSARRRSAIVTITAVAALAAMQLPAVSDQSPAGCTANDPGLNITRDKTYIRSGDVVTYRVEIHNLGTSNGPACDISDATVTLIAPAADGSATGVQTLLASGLNLPAGTPLTQMTPVAWTVALNPGVFDAVARAELTGTVHDGPVNHTAQVVKTLGTALTFPWTELSVVASPTSGQGPLPVTFTYTEKNTGNAPIDNVVVTDDVCAPVVYSSGDTGNDKVFGPGEVWTFSCTTTLTNPGPVTSHVKAVGNNVQDNRPAPDEAASASVQVSAPPPTTTAPPPQVLGEQTIRELPRTL